MRNCMIVMGLALAGITAETMAQDEPLDDRWYLAPAVGLTYLDEDRGTKRSDLYYGLGFGRFFTPDFSLDVRLDRYSTRVRGGVPAGEGSDRFGILGLGLVGRYYLNGERTRPYGLLGVGIQEHDSYLDDGRDIYGSLGLGLLTRVNENVDLRMEAEARYDNDRDTLDRSSGFLDYIVSLGMTFKFGEPPRAPAPPEPEPEPAAPAPAPAPEPAPEPEPEILFEFDAAVTFALDSARLRPEAVAELNEAVALLELHDDIRRVEVAGHTCDLGPADYNQNLSQRRARAVADYLVEHGIDGDRLVVRGFGEDQPRVPNTSEANRSQNRRVVLSVLERD